MIDAWAAGWKCGAQAGENSGYLGHVRGAGMDAVRVRVVLGDEQLARLAIRQQQHDETLLGDPIE